MILNKKTMVLTAGAVIVAVVGFLIYILYYSPNSSIIVTDYESCVRAGGIDSPEKLSQTPEGIEIGIGIYDTAYCIYDGEYFSEIVL